MSAEEEIPILITCGCESAVPTLEAVSRSQNCGRSNCGHIPCRGEACTPNFDNLSVDQKCYPQRYLKQVRTWQVRPSSSSDYAGGQNAALMLNILKLLENEEIDNLLETESNSEEIAKISDVSILSGTPRIETSPYAQSDIFGCGQLPTYDNGVEAYCKSDPCPTVTYSEPTPDVCNPKTLPEFPAFSSPCGGEDVPLLPGQGRSATARDLDAPPAGIVDKQLVKYRIRHFPTRTGYLKVWIRQKIQQYQWRSEPPPPGSGGGSSGGTGGGSNSNPDACKQWYPVGEETVQSVKEYTWESDEYKEDPQCQDIILSSQDNFVTTNGKVARLEISKYSYVKGYTPDDPETTPRCKPDGFPTYNTDPTCGP
jgi:hypothetical protein